jgi:hypothetical protein
MITNRRFALLGFVAVSALALGAQDATLTRVLTPNSTEVYKVDTVVDMNVTVQAAEMPLSLKTGMTFQVKTGNVDPAKGTGDVEVTTTVDKFDAGDSPLAGLMGKQEIKPVVQKGTVNKLGRFQLENPTTKDMRGAAISGAQNSTLSTLSIELPDHAVKVGDTWEIVIPKGPLTGDADQKLTAKLVGDKQVDGHNAWVVDVSGTLKTSFDSSKLPPDDSGGGNSLSGMQIIVNGSNDITAEALIDKVTGQTLSNDSTAKIKLTMEAPTMGLNGTGAGTATSKLKLQP